MLRWQQIALYLFYRGIHEAYDLSLSQRWKKRRENELHLKKNISASILSYMSHVTASLQLVNQTLKFKCECYWFSFWLVDSYFC